MPWNLTGNGGTNPKKDFIGTTDLKAVVVRTNKKEALRVDPNGNVGIGTPNPQNQLHVGAGSSSIAASRVNAVVASNNPDAGMAIAQNGGVNVLLQASTSGGFFGTTSNHPLALRTNDQDAVVVDATGKVGVGVDASFLGSISSKMVVGGSPVGPTTPPNGLTVLGATVNGIPRSSIIIEPDLPSITIVAGGVQGQTLEIDSGGIGNPSGQLILFTGQQIVITAGVGGLVLNSDLTVNGNAKFQGGKQGFLVDEFVNCSGTVLERGDLLTLRRTDARERYSDRIPIPQVELAREAYAVEVCGVVDGPVVQPEHRCDDAISAEVPPGARGLMVTIGCYADCKVDADVVPIEVGDLLTASSTPGHAQKVLDRSRAVGAIVGKALKAVEKGKATIPILVLLH